MNASQPKIRKKQWDPPRGDFILSLVPEQDENKMAQQNSSQIFAMGPSPVTEKQVEYLKMLEERNRLKKKMKAPTKEEKEVQLKERGWNSTSSGMKDTNLNRKPKSKLSSSPISVVQPKRSQSAPTSKSKGESTTRRQWSRETFSLPDGNGILKTANEEVNNLSSVVDRSQSCGELDEYLDESFEEFEEESEEAVEPIRMSKLLIPEINKEDIVSPLNTTTSRVASASVGSRSQIARNKPHTQRPLTAKNKPIHEVAREGDNVEDTAAVLYALALENERVRRSFDEEPIPPPAPGCTPTRPIHKEVKVGIEITVEDKTPRSNSSTKLNDFNIVSNGGNQESVSSISTIEEVVHGLGKQKQENIVKLLETFSQSSKREEDVEELRHSIGDPNLWRKLTGSVAMLHHYSSREGSTMSSTMRKQREEEEEVEWRQKYSQRVQERKERELRDEEEAVRRASERRKELNKKLEEEEMNHLRMIEERRRERLAKLKEEEEEEERKATERRINRILHISESTPNLSSFKIDHPTEKQFLNLQQQQQVDNEQLPQQQKVVLDSLDTSSTTIFTVVTATSALENMSENSSLLEPNSVGKGSMFQVDGISKNETAWGSEITLKLLSGWGKSKMVGLTQVDVYDVENKPIPVCLSSLQLVSGVGLHPIKATHQIVQEVPRIFNGVANTTSEDQMWLARLPENAPLSIIFRLSQSTMQLGKLRIWNYNRETSIGVQDMEILINGQFIWTGSLNKGAGNITEDYSTWIDISKKCEKPNSKSNYELKGDRPIWLSHDGIRESQSSTSLQAPSSLQVEIYSNKQNYEKHRRKKGEISLLENKNMDHPSPLLENGKSSLLFKGRGSKNTALQASWDSLEHFSKTNRGRLPQDNQGNPPFIMVVEDSTKVIQNDVIDHVIAKSNRSSRRHHLLAEKEVIEIPRNKDKCTTNKDELTKTINNHDKYKEENSFVNNREMSQKFKPKWESFYGDVSPGLFQVPPLPNGKVLKITILSTWGDPHYVGLNGIDIFDSLGQLVHISEHQIDADPKDINELEDYQNDPRKIRNIVDGVNNTCDDMHVWLAPFYKGRENTITITMKDVCCISMLRIWNYNKSRTHSYRGVKMIRIHMDEALIFEGELRKAPGMLAGMDQCAEVILFTSDQVILKLIESTDAMDGSLTPRDDTSFLVAEALSRMESCRPHTAGTEQGARMNDTTIQHSHLKKLWRLTKAEEPEESYEQHLAGSSCTFKNSDLGADGRPKTAAISSSSINYHGNGDKRIKNVLPSVDESMEMNEALDRSGEYISGKNIVIQIRNSWGDPHYVGLGGLQILVGLNGSCYPLTPNQIDANPRDLQQLGYSDDPRTLEKLLDNVNVTHDDTHMWLIPLTEGVFPSIKINLESHQNILGIRIWNYNKNKEDTYRGVKRIDVFVDDVRISPSCGFCVRKAPGHVLFDYGHVIRFYPPGSPTFISMEKSLLHPLAHSNYVSPSIKQDYEAPLYPHGFILKFVALSSWGDPYYIGLNGIELYDFNGDLIDVSPDNVTAQPYSVSDLNERQDSRVPGNLVNHKNNTWDASESWLAPLASSIVEQEHNSLYIYFSTPIVLSKVKVWNYSKTPDRGVREFELWMDDIHIFRGNLRPAPPVPQPTRNAKAPIPLDFGQPIFFTNNLSIITKEKAKVVYCGNEEQDVMCINEGQIVHESNAMYRNPDPSAEGVYVDLGLRPVTAVSR